MRKLIIVLSIVISGVAFYMMYPEIDMTWFSITGLWIGYIINSVLSEKDLMKQKNFEIKQKYYHEFLKIFSIKLNYITKNPPKDSNQEEDEELKKINKEFAFEVSRLSLYASSEVIDLIEKMKDNEKNFEVKEMINLIREDLNLPKIKGRYGLTGF